MKLVALLGLLVLTLSIGQLYQISQISKKYVEERNPVNPITIRSVASLQQQPDQQIDYEELQMVLSVIGSGGYTTSLLHGENDMEKLAAQLKPTIQKMLFIKEEDLNALVLDILTCKGGEDSFLFRPVLDKMEDKPNITNLPIMKYRYNAVVATCPSESSRTFDLGLILYDVDLILKYAVSEEVEKKCLAIEDSRKRDDCFFDNHKPEDKFSQARMDNLNRFMVYTAQKETKRFIERFKI